MTLLVCARFRTYGGLPESQRMPLSSLENFDLQFWIYSPTMLEQMWSASCRRCRLYRQRKEVAAHPQSAPPFNRRSFDNLFHLSEGKAFRLFAFERAEHIRDLTFRVRATNLNSGTVPFRHVVNSATAACALSPGSRRACRWRSIPPRLFSAGDTTSPAHPNPGSASATG